MRNLDRRDETPKVTGRDPNVGIACTCLGITQHAVQREIKRGCDEFEALRDRLGCGSVCGSCVPTIRELLGERAWTPTRVVDMHEVAEDLVCYRLERPPTGSTAWLPGQHIVVQARVDGALVERVYTLTSLPDAPYYEVVIKREPGGLLSNWMCTRRGDDSVLRVSRPHGEFVLDPGPGSAVCLVAGVGMTPAIAMARAVARGTNGVKLHVHVSVRHRRPALLVDELQRLAAGHAALTCQVRETSTEGRIGARELRALARRHPRAGFFVCGPERYLHAVPQSLRAAGIPEDRIRLEAFTRVRAKPSPGAVTSAHDGTWMVPPAPPREASTRQGRLFPWLARIHGVTNALALDHHTGRPRPHLLWAAIDRLAARVTKVDARLPRDRLGALGALVFSPRNHALASFERAVLQTRRVQREAKCAHDPHTPDGDALSYLIPNAPLMEFQGPHAVETGWTRAGDRPVLPVILVRGRSAVARILGDPSRFERGAIPYHYVQQALGSSKICPHERRKAAGLFAGQLHENRTWDEDRGLANELFGYDRMEVVGPRLDAALARIVAELWDERERWPDRIVDLNVLTSRIAFRMVLEATFGPVLDPAFSRLGLALIEPVRRMMNQVKMILNGSVGLADAFAQSVHESKRIIREMIALVRRCHARGALGLAPEDSPILSMIVHGDGNGEPIDIDRLSTFLFPVLFGGHETTGHTIAWAIYETCRSPDLEHSVRSERARFVARHHGRSVRPRHYVERPCALAMLYEIGRRHPGLTTIPRTATRAGELPADPHSGIGAIRYPRHALFMISIVGVHMDPRRHRQAERFDIERFMVGRSPGMSDTELGALVMANARALEARRDLLTFGGGPGICPGRGFNQLEFFLVLDALFGRFRFELEHPGLELHDSADPVSGPETGRLTGWLRPV